MFATESNDSALKFTNESFYRNYSYIIEHDGLQFSACTLILLSFCIFVVGIVGNLLVVLVVIKNAHMRTITNIFIVNLAIGDILVILICLPPTILTDVTGNWYFGEAMCQIIPYVQVSYYFFHFQVNLYN